VSGLRAIAGLHLEIYAVSACIQLYCPFENVPVAMDLHRGDDFGTGRAVRGQFGLGGSFTQELCILHLDNLLQSEDECAV
jgi:hypothetical protein